MRDRLTIGEVARLIGVTTKAVRHYHKIELLAEPERSESGYRLYGADELLRLQRIRRLRSFGLSLKRIKTVLGETGDENSLREVLTALHEEISSEIEMLEGRRRRLESLLAQDDEDVSIEPSEKPYAIKLAEEHLGKHLSEISSGLWEQERRMWTTLDAFEWPEGYKEMQELITFYYADHPDEFREMILLGERLAALADLPEGSHEVERLAEDLARHLEQTPFPYDPLEDSPLTSRPVGEVFAEVLNSNFSPAQLRAMELVHKYFDEKSRS
jgi:DNA-binding transcriptional MerR regulator